MRNIEPPKCNPPPRSTLFSYSSKCKLCCGVWKTFTQISHTFPNLSLYSRRACELAFSQSHSATAKQDRRRKWATSGAHTSVMRVDFHFNRIPVKTSFMSSFWWHFFLNPLFSLRSVAPHFFPDSIPKVLSCFMVIRAGQKCYTTLGFSNSLK